MPMCGWLRPRKSDSNFLCAHEFGVRSINRQGLKFMAVPFLAFLYSIAVDLLVKIQTCSGQPLPLLMVAFGISFPHTRLCSL